MPLQPPSTDPNLGVTNPPPVFNTTAPPAYPAASDVADAAGGRAANDPGDLQTGALPPVVPEQFTADFYDEGHVEGRYDGHSGLLAMPVAGPPGTPCEVIRFCAPYATRVQEWSVVRVGSKPRLPAPAPNANEVLLDWTVFPMSGSMSPGGKKVYRTSGRYVYQLLVPPAVPGQGSDALSCGQPPWVQGSPSDDDVVPGQWDQTLLNSAGSVPAGFVPPTQ